MHLGTNHFHLKCSQRRNIKIEVIYSGEVFVYAPDNCNYEYLLSVIEGKRNWIKKRQQLFRNAELLYESNAFDKELIINKGNYSYESIIDKAQFYSKLTGFKYRSISIKSQKKRWGSCNNRGDIIYNWKIAFLPQPVMEYIILHEIIHLKEFNHSPRFYAAVHEVIPDYKTAIDWLNTYGDYYLQRLAIDGGE